MRPVRTVVVIGAGMGGLSAAADLARQGERAKQQADANAQSNYKGDVEALRRLAQQRQEQLKSQIEADQPAQ